MLQVALGRPESTHTLCSEDEIVTGEMWLEFSVVF